MPATYIVCPNLCIPPSGPLQLGHILKCPFDTEVSPLNLRCLVPIPPTDLFTPDVKTGFCAGRSELKSSSLGIWARFLSVLRVGLHASKQAQSDDILRISTLETHTFDPSDEYVKQSMQMPHIQAYLAERRDRVTLYMVTGVKIARGVAMALSDSKATGISGHVGAPVAGGADVGAGGDYKHSRLSISSFEESTDFVLAFRVRKISVEKERITMKSYTKGATMQGTVLELGGGGGEMSVKLSGELTDEDLKLMLDENDMITEDAESDIQWIHCISE